MRKACPALLFRNAPRRGSLNLESCLHWNNAKTEIRIRPLPVAPSAHERTIPAHRRLLLRVPEVKVRVGTAAPLRGVTRIAIVGYSSPFV